MPLRIASILLTSVVALVWRTAPASACDPASFDTPYDLADRSTTVAVVEVDALGTNKATVTLVEALKGTLAATVALDADLESTCSPGMTAGARGLVYLDAAGHMLGHYDGFVRDTAVIDALRAYTAATTAAERAAPLVDLAVSRDWSRSFNAAFALANRVDLARALDAPARARVIKRLAKVGQQHPLIMVAARFHDAGVAKLQKRRRFDDGKALAGVLAGTFDAETDRAVLADAIAAAATPRAHRIAAMERCEQLRGISLARITEYAAAASADDVAAWRVRAEACRTGTPVP